MYKSINRNIYDEVDILVDAQYNYYAIWQLQGLYAFATQRTDEAIAQWSDLYKLMKPVPVSLLPPIDSPQKRCVMPRVHRTFPIYRIKSALKSGRKALLIGLLPLLLLTSTVYAEGISKIDIIVSTCFTCHGVEGVGSGKIPELSDLKKSDITESMLGFA
jgi:hypothetical protein